MTEAEKRRRASEAERISKEPLLVEVFAVMENTAIERILGAHDKSDDPDRDRRLLAERVNVIRKVRNDLAAMIAHGTEAQVDWAV